MSAWRDVGVIRYLGVTDDMKSFLADANCVVLPSFYREGVPRTLLQARDGLHYHYHRCGGLP